jgi:TDG/mug DNA glycosylase family protein
MLPDYLAPGLRVVFCGTAVGTRSAAVGGYYAGPGNEFWGTLLKVGLVPEPLGPSLSHRVLEFGIGLTDLVKNIAASSDRGLRGLYDVAGFVAKIEKSNPRWIAFHGKEAAKPVSAAMGAGKVVQLGKQGWYVGLAKVFVVPSMSGSNRNPKNWDGRDTRESWWFELAELIGRDGS